MRRKAIGAFLGRRTPRFEGKVDPKHLIARPAEWRQLLHEAESAVVLTAPASRAIGHPGTFRNPARGVGKGRSRTAEVSRTWSLQARPRPLLDTLRRTAFATLDDKEP